MSACAKLRSDLVSASAEIDGATVYNIKDPITVTSYCALQPLWTTGPSPVIPANLISVIPERAGVHFTQAVYRYGNPAQWSKN